MSVSIQEEIQWKNIQELATKIDELAEDRLIDNAEIGKEVRPGINMVNTSLQKGMVKFDTDYTAPFCLKLGKNAKMTTNEKFYQRFEFCYYNFKRVDYKTIKEEIARAEADNNTQRKEELELQLTQYMYKPVEGYQELGDNERYYGTNSRHPILVHMYLATLMDNYPLQFGRLFSDKVIKQPLKDHVGNVFGASQLLVENMIETHMDKIYRWWPHVNPYATMPVISPDLYAVLEDLNKCQLPVRICPVRTPEDPLLSHNNNNNTESKRRKAIPYKNRKAYENEITDCRIQDITSWQDAMTLSEVGFNKYIPETYDIDDCDHNWAAPVPPICDSCYPLKFPMCGLEGGKYRPIGDFEAGDWFTDEALDVNIYNVEEILGSTYHTYWYRDYFNPIPRKETGELKYVYKKDWVWAEDYKDYESASTWVSKIVNGKITHIRMTNLRFMIGDYGDNIKREEELNIIHQDCVTVATAIVIEIDGFLTTAMRKRWYDMLYFKLKYILGYWYDTSLKNKDPEFCIEDEKDIDYVPDLLENYSIVGPTWNYLAENVLNSTDEPCNRWLQAGLGWLLLRDPEDLDDYDEGPLLNRSASGTKYWEQYLLALGKWAPSNVLVDVYGGFPLALKNEKYWDDCQDPEFQGQLVRPWNGGYLGSNMTANCASGGVRYLTHASTFNILEMTYQLLLAHKIKELKNVNKISPVSDWNTCSPRFGSGQTDNFYYDAYYQYPQGDYSFIPSYSDKPIVDAGCWYEGDDVTLEVTATYTDPRNISFNISPINLTINDCPCYLEFKCDYDQDTYIYTEVEKTVRTVIEDRNGDTYIINKNLYRGDVTDDGGWLMQMANSLPECPGEEASCCDINAGIWFYVNRGGTTVYHHRVWYTLTGVHTDTEEGYISLAAVDHVYSGAEDGGDNYRYWACPSVAQGIDSITIHNTVYDTINCNVTVDSIDITTTINNNCTIPNDYKRYITSNEVLVHGKPEYRYIYTKDVIYRYALHKLSMSTANQTNLKNDMQANIMANISHYGAEIYVDTSLTDSDTVKDTTDIQVDNEQVKIGRPTALTSTVRNITASGINILTRDSIHGDVTSAYMWEGSVDAKVKFEENNQPIVLNSPLKGYPIKVNVNMGANYTNVGSDSKTLLATTDSGAKYLVNVVGDTLPDGQQRISWTMTGNKQMQPQWDASFSCNEKSIKLQLFYITNNVNPNASLSLVVDTYTSYLENISRNTDFSNCYDWIDKSEENSDFLEYWCRYYYSYNKTYIESGNLQYLRWTQTNSSCNTIRNTKYVLQNSTTTLPRSEDVGEDQWHQKKDSIIIMMNPNAESDSQASEGIVRGCAVANVWSTYIIPAKHEGFLRVTVKSPLKRGAVREHQYMLKAPIEGCNSNLPNCTNDQIIQIGNLTPVPNHQMYGTLCGIAPNCTPIKKCNKGGALYAKPWVVGLQFGETAAIIGTVRSIPGDGDLCRDKKMMELDVQKYLDSTDDAHVMFWDFESSNDYSMRVVVGCTLLLNSFDTDKSLTDINNLDALMFTPTIEPVQIDVEIMKDDENVQ